MTSSGVKTTRLTRIHVARFVSQQAKTGRPCCFVTHRQQCPWIRARRKVQSFRFGTKPNRTEFPFACFLCPGVRCVPEVNWLVGGRVCCRQGKDIPRHGGSDWSGIGNLAVGNSLVWCFWAVRGDYTCRVKIVLWACVETR